MTMKILSRPRGNAEEYGRWSVNPYVGCPHGCSYCYLKKGVWAKELGGNVPRLKKGIVNFGHAHHLAMVEIYEHREQIIKDGGVFMSFVTDPCAKETRDLFFSLIKEIVRADIDVTILTKNADFFLFSSLGVKPNSKEQKKRSELLGAMISEGKREQIVDAMSFIAWLDDVIYDVKERVYFGWTLTGHDELEPNASTNEERIATMKRMSDEGYKTWASIEPVIDFQSSYKMVCQALRAGCQHFKIGLLTSNTRVVRKDFQIGKYQFKTYDRDACVTFIHEVMRAIKGDSTVYWKQSFRDFLGEEDFVRATIGYKNIVDKDWSMFNKED